MNGAEGLVRMLVVKLDELATQFKRGLAHRGPYLLERVL